MRSVLFRNIENLICDFLPKLSGFRIPITRVLFDGLTFQQVAAHFPRIPANIVRFALGRTGDNFPESNMFKPNITRKSTARITEFEKQATLKALEPFLEFRSGQRSDAKYTRFSRKELYDRYVSVYHEVVASSKIEMNVEPRCYKSFYGRLLRGIRISKIKHPHDCPICSPTFISSIDAAITRYRQTVLESESKSSVRKATLRMAALEEKKKSRSLHLKKNSDQRAYYQRVKSTMGPDDCILVMDYVSSHYSAGGSMDGVGGKYNILVIAVEYRPEGHDKPIRRFFDYPCCMPNNKHDLQHLAHAFLHLFEESNWMTINGKCNFKNMWRVSDNGQPFKSTGFMYLESYIAAKHKLNYEVIFLCPYHAFSICDGHGGSVKKVIHSAHVQQRVPTKAGLYRDLIDTRVQDTRSYPIESLNIGAINAAFDIIGGYDQVAPSESFKNYSSFRYLTGDLAVRSSLGCAHARVTALMNYDWGDVCGIDTHQFPTWRFIWFIKHAEKTCLVCPFVQSKVITLSGHDCPFKDKILAYRTARNLPTPTTNIDITEVEIGDDESISESSISDTETDTDETDVPQRKNVKLYEVEKIVLDDVRDGIRQYYVKWAGYPESDNTWEIDLPQESIDLYLENKQLELVYSFFSLQYSWSFIYHLGPCT